jgi:hypothetical protein
MLSDLGYQASHPDILPALVLQSSMIFLCSFSFSAASLHHFCAESGTISSSSFFLMAFYLP